MKASTQYTLALNVFQEFDLDAEDFSNMDFVWDQNLDAPNFRKSLYLFYDPEKMVIGDLLQGTLNNENKS
jgi:hypothetical protein